MIVKTKQEILDECVEEAIKMSKKHMPQSEHLTKEEWALALVLFNQRKSEWGVKY